MEFMYSGVGEAGGDYPSHEAAGTSLATYSNSTDCSRVRCGWQKKVASSPLKTPKNTFRDLTKVNDV